MPWKTTVLPAPLQLPTFTVEQLLDLDGWFKRQIDALQRGHKRTREAYGMTKQAGWKKNMDYYKNALSTARWMRANLRRTIASRKGENASGRRGVG
jgi:hypothetical protein